MSSSSSSQNIKYLKDYHPPPYSIPRAFFSFLLDAKETVIRAELLIRRHPDTPSGTVLTLDGYHLDHRFCAIEGQELSSDGLKMTCHSLSILTPPEAPEFTLVTEVAIAPEKNKALEGLYLSDGILCTQCEAEGFRHISWFIDRPDNLCLFTVKLTAKQESYPVLLSNGHMIAQGAAADGFHWVTWQDPIPKPCYLFAVIAGVLGCLEDRFTTSDGRIVTIRFFSKSENLPALSFACKALKKAMAWDESTYQRVYDLDLYMVVAIHDFNMGAMENKGLNIFNTKYILIDEDIATDEDYLQVELVIAHEYFHNWTGNRITCRDWFQLSLKEGLTVFREQQYAASLFSAAVQRIRDIAFLRQRQFPEDQGPLAHPVQPDSYQSINNFYTTTIYEKGAELIHMLKTFIGEKSFYEGMALYFARFDLQAVTIDDFLDVMQSASGQNLSVFRNWYHQAGTPILYATQDYDPDQKTLKITLEQTNGKNSQQPLPPLAIPVKIGLYDRQTGQAVEAVLEGQQAPAASHILTFQQKKQVFSLKEISALPLISWGQGFSAPVIFPARKTEERAFLLQYDQDHFNKWDCAQDWFFDLFTHAYHQRKTPKAETSGKRLQNLGQSLCEALIPHFQETDFDPAFLAELITPPPLSSVINHLQEIAMPQLYHAYQDVTELVAQKLLPQLLAYYHHIPPGDKSDFSAHGRGLRLLKNRTLLLISLCSGNHPDIVDIISRHYYQSSTATESLAAFYIIANSYHPQREEVLTEFAHRWQNTPLMFDHWFAAQAISIHREDALICWDELQSHPHFAWDNPNRVYALIGRFCRGNPRHFHGHNGRAYEMLCKILYHIDGQNPQMAARLLTAFEQTHLCSHAMQEKLYDLLEEFCKSPTISADCFEISQKILQSLTKK